MFRATGSLFVISIMSLVVAGTGCEDQKAKIGMLEESNGRLTNDLQAARAELQRMQQDRDACQGELAQARQEIEGLASQLAAPSEVDVPSGWTAVPGGAMIAIEGSVLFAPGKVTLRSEAQRTLESVSGALRDSYADKDILVFGHTDDMPIKKSGWDDNYQLSTERALAVVRWLRDHGLSPKRLVACGCGEHRPRVPNSSTQNRGQNRRVEIFALDADVQTASR